MPFSVYEKHRQRSGLFFVYRTDPDPSQREDR
jgi:hypothetical protein